MRIRKRLKTLSASLLNGSLPILMGINWSKYRIKNFSSTTVSCNYLTHIPALEEQTTISKNSQSDIQDMDRRRIGHPLFQTVSSWCTKKGEIGDFKRCLKIMKGWMMSFTYRLWSCSVWELLLYILGTKRHKRTRGIIIISFNSSDDCISFD